MKALASPAMKKAVVVALIAAALTAFLVLDLDRYLTLEALKSGRAALEEQQSQRPWVFAAAFFGVYVLVAALSVPGAAIMTLAAGALFGFTGGTLLASFASAIGASLAFLISRHLFRDSVQRAFAQKLRAIDEGMERDGAFYLFTLRLVPVFPFFLINLLMGLTPISLRRFYWVSQAGMLAGTVVYVNAGTQLARIDSLAQIASPGLLLAFLLLGLFPWIARALLGFLRRRRVYARWRRPKTFDRNLVVIGAGAAGLVSAYVAATVKARVTLIEANRMGGDCLNYGCIPSKALIRSARLAHHMRTADRYGLDSAEPRFSFRSVMARVHDVIRAVEPHDSVERYTALGVEVMEGHGRVVDPWTVDISLMNGHERTLTTRSIVIAAGASPSVPPIPGLEEVGYVTSDTLWKEFAGLDEAPPRLAVLGGGPIGCELAQAFARLGSKVTLVETLPRLIAREDEEVSALARRALERDGVTVLTGHTAVRCENAGSRRTLVVEGSGEERHIEFDSLLCALGRKARLQGYGLEELGIPVDKTVTANEYLETLYPNIFAAGDVAGPYQFTHMAGHQAWYAAVNALFGGIRRFKVDYSAVPWTTFIDPEVARVGLNEQEAKEKAIDFEITRYPLDELDRAITDGAREGFVKVLTRRGTDRILGVTLVGEHAGELLAEFVLALKHGIGLNKILGTIHTYPTFSEASKYAAGQWKRAHVSPRWLAWAERYLAWQRG